MSKTGLVPYEVVMDAVCQVGNMNSLQRAPFADLKVTQTWVSLEKARTMLMVYVVLPDGMDCTIWKHCWSGVLSTLWESKLR